MGVFEECLVGEEFGYGCTGIATAIGGTNLGVSALLLDILYMYMCRMLYVGTWYLNQLLDADTKQV